MLPTRVRGKMLPTRVRDKMLPTRVRDKMLPTRVIVMLRASSAAGHMSEVDAEDLRACSCVPRSVHTDEEMAGFGGRDVIVTRVSKPAKRERKESEPERPPKGGHGKRQVCAGVLVSM
jgi:hypothetical protein